MPPLLLVMAGGAIGSGARHLTGRAMLSALGPNWPWGTLTVNIVGGFLMGLLVGTLASRAQGDGEIWRLLLGVGALGGFTTFSAFSLEIALMLQRGSWGAALAYVALSLIGAIGAVVAGLALTRAIA